MQCGKAVIHIRQQLVCSRDPTETGPGRDTFVTATHTQPPTILRLAAELDLLLDSAVTPDYPNALNGLQFAAEGPLRGIAAAVDFSTRAIGGAAEAGANVLIVHHGMFWGGLQPVVGPAYRRVRMLLEHGIGVYASHLPLDRHPTLGNNVLLAAELGLAPSGGFARYAGMDIGVQGESDVETDVLAERARGFARAYNGEVCTAGLRAGRSTRRWAICTGAGASSATLAEAAAAGIDTLITGEGPHHTAVEADELGIAVIYAGHYATETLGVRALATYAAELFGVPWTFVAAPTGL